MTTTTPAQMLTIQQTADRLGVSPRTVQRLTAAGALPLVRHTRRAIRIPAPAVDAYITRCTTHHGDGNASSQ